MLRIALGLLRCFEPTLLRLDLVGLSLFMKDLRDRQLQTPAQRAQLLSSILGVSSVTECSFRALDEEYARVATRRATLDYTPRVWRPNRRLTQRSRGAAAATVGGAAGRGEDPRAAGAGERAGAGGEGAVAGGGGGVSAGGGGAGGAGGVQAAAAGAGGDALLQRAVRCAACQRRGAGAQGLSLSAGRERADAAHRAGRGDHEAAPGGEGGARAAAGGGQEAWERRLAPM